MVTESLPAPQRVPFRRLVPVIAVIGLTSLGGGRFAYFHDAMVEKRRWLTDREFLEGLTISQIIPGPTFANFTVFIAQRLGGALGALIGLILILTPGALAMMLMTYFYTVGMTEFGWLDIAFKGIGAAAAGLTVVTMARLVKPSQIDRPTIVIALITFVALGPLNLSILHVVPPLALVGLWLNRPGAGRGA